MIQNNQELMDIGKHCQYCGQIDFLPFICDDCNLILCSDHRSSIQHECAAITSKQQPKFKPVIEYAKSTQTAASLFPDRSKDKLILEKSLNEPKPTTIIEKLSSKPSALKKLKKFLSLQTKKPSIFKPKVSSATNKILTLSICKKTAIGDAKIPVSERVYIWCIYIAEQDFNKTSLDTEKRAIFISRTWPVGRALDQIAVHLKIKNINNMSNDPKDRLSVFRNVRDKSDGIDPILINNNGRVIKEFKDGDLIYLVRGADV